MRKIALITAGGSGTRMKSSIPKQFMLLNNFPIIMHSINAFYRYDKSIEFVVTLPENQFNEWDSLCNKYDFFVKHTIVKGGESRFHSVVNALDTLKGEALIAIHDAVRPLVSTEVIASAFESAAINGSAVPVIPLVDSVRKIDGDGSIVTDRTQLRLVQTPQCFLLSGIKKAYQCSYNEKFTDDASVFESKGNKIFLSEGNKENIKITTSSDILIAKAILSYFSIDEK